MSDTLNVTEDVGLRDLGGFTVSKTDPLNVAKAVLHHRETAVKEEVASNVALTEGYTALRHDKEMLGRLVKALINAKVLPESEAYLGEEAKRSHLSMLKKISEHADVILHRNILPLLSTGYSVLYQVSLLSEDLGRNINHVREVLKASDGPLTRDFLIKQRQALKPANDTSQIQREPAGQRKNDEAEPVEALLLTPRRQDIVKLKKDYVSAGEPACLRFATRVASSAALVIAARTADLSALSGKLPCWGFEEFSRVYLLKPPSGPELTSVEIIAVCERGKPKITRWNDWPANANARLLAEDLLSDIAGRRVHVFAEKSTEGWETVVGDANWSNERETAA